MMNNNLLLDEKYKPDFTEEPQIAFRVDSNEVIMIGFSLTNLDI